ncbi:hypothetical protein SUREIYA_00350 [Serratia phage vB_SmaM-Sureiya]|nr:hypothetical protein SUREIYA_00350 [Serratia phage vB_SmaM-Sureiya]
MIVNKECLRKLAELTISRLIIDGTQIAWSGDYQINLLDGNIDILIDVKLSEVGDYGVRLALNHTGTTIGTIVIKDCRMFSRDALKVELSKWREQTQKYLINNFAKWLVNRHIKNDLNVKHWICAASTDDLIGSMFLSGLRFKAKVRLNTAWFQVEENDVVLYRVERSNFLNMTTEQGWQGMNINTVTAELGRVLVTLLAQREGFLIPVVM